MSLHGTIEINNKLIGTYTIRRTEDLSTMNYDHRYEWSVVINDQEIHGECYHVYDRGAISLISMVMQEAASEHRSMGPRIPSPWPEELGPVRRERGRKLRSLQGTMSDSPAVGTDPMGETAR
jgi:hypothetical protein